MAAAIPTIASVGIGLIASKFAKSKQQDIPAPTALPAAPDAALMARHAMEAAQSAAAIQKRRAQSPQQLPSTLLTGPAGLPTPAPVVRKQLIGQ